MSDRKSMCHQSALSGQALEPFRAVNDPVRPFISDFRLQQRISTNAFLDLVWGP